MGSVERIAAALVAAGIATSAHAGEEPGWSVGAGVGIASGVVPSVPLGSSVGVLSPDQVFAPSPVDLPGFAVSLERRLAPSAWMLLQARVAYRSFIDEIDRDLLTETTAAQVELGPRLVIVPSPVVEVSAYLVAGVGYSYLFSRSVQHVEPDATVEGKATAWSGSATAGFAFERELVSRLAVRLSADVLGVRYVRGTARAEGGGSSDEDRTHSFRAGLAFSPSLELRLAF